MNLVTKETEIDWNSDYYYVIRDGELMRSRNWRDINEGEEYCVITQSPSTPPDFGLLVTRREPLVIVEGYGPKPVPINDEFLRGVTNMDYCNYTGIKDYLNNEGEFYNWYDMEFDVKTGTYKPKKKDE